MGKYPREDKIRLEYLKSLVSPTQGEMDEIFTLYNKYAGSAPNYNTSCNCHNAIQNLFWELIGWYGKNSNNFED